jgi:hypothetical protein
LARHRTEAAARGEMGGSTTHHYVWHLAKRLVLEVRRLLVLAFHKVDGNELVRDVALLGYQGHAARAGGH